MVGLQAANNPTARIAIFAFTAYLLGRVATLYHGSASGAARPSERGFYRAQRPLSSARYPAPNELKSVTVWPSS
jgi:hypothetical protein